MSDHPSDNEIIKRVLQGESRAYGILVSKYQRYVFTLVVRQIKNREDAEDVAQEVFIRAYRYLRDFKGKARFSTWLYSIAYNTTISWLKKRKLNTVSFEGREERYEPLAGLPDADDHQAIVEQKMINIESAVKQLSEDDAFIITLFYLGEQSIEEIGRILHIQPNAAKVRLHRARARLRKLVENDLDDLGSR